MSTVKLVEYDEAGDEVRAVYDDIRRTRQTDYINNRRIGSDHPNYLFSFS